MGFLVPGVMSFQFSQLQILLIDGMGKKSVRVPQHFQ